METKVCQREMELMGIGEEGKSHEGGSAKGVLQGILPGSIPGRIPGSIPMRMLGALGKRCRDFAKREEGMGTVEIVLIIVVLVGLVIVFQEQIQGLVESVFAAITQKKDVIVNY